MLPHEHRKDKLAGLLFFAPSRSIQEETLCIDTIFRTGGEIFNIHHLKLEREFIDWDHILSSVILQCTRQESLHDEAEYSSSEARSKARQL